MLVLFCVFILHAFGYLVINGTMWCKIRGGTLDLEKILHTYATHILAATKRFLKVEKWLLLVCMCCFYWLIVS